MNVASNCAARALSAALVLGCLGSLAGQDSLRRELRDSGVADHWIYDDWQAARALAAKQGKPIFALFRCVP